VAAGALVAAGRLTDSDRSSGSPVAATVDRFDERRAFEFLEWQVRLGPRPAGSAAARKLAARLRSTIPAGRYQAVPGGLRNVIGTVPGRQPGRVVVVGSHYDTKEIPGFVGANDGASSTAVVRELARTIEPGEARSTLVFAFFDGEESPRGTPSNRFEERGLRGSKVASRVFRDASAMVLLDLVGDKDLSFPQEAGSDQALFERIRAAARRVGKADYFPALARPQVLDDHIPFQKEGVPAAVVIDFEFACWHRRCDNLQGVSAESLDVIGETMLELLREL